MSECAVLGGDPPRVVTLTFNPIAFVRQGSRGRVRGSHSGQLDGYIKGYRPGHDRETFSPCSVPVLPPCNVELLKHYAGMHASFLFPISWILVSVHGYSWGPRHC